MRLGMDKDKALKELKGIIMKYILEKDVAESLVERVNGRNVKGILAELDKNKSEKISDLDMERIRDIYYHYC
ncbi:hypothetical protein [Fusobacterium sp. PH5-44]|uniref:hypothetical protein n=1 Tax=unclassified Fusobacterium TaxID=2648384 RepID=UPI003D213CF0